MKKHLLKLFTLLLATAACLALFAACSPAEEPPEEKPEHTHTWGDWTTVKEANCTEAGKQERFCECGERESKETKHLGILGENGKR